MNKRNYNPLNEGYSAFINTKEYKLDGMTGSTAPTTLVNIQSAVVKPNESNASDKDTSDSDTSKSKNN